MQILIRTFWENDTQIHFYIILNFRTPLQTRTSQNKNFIGILMVQMRCDQLNSANGTEHFQGIY